MDQSATVSVILTTHYRNGPLNRALEKCITQTYDNVEIIVVDDSGSSHAEPVVSEYNNIRYIPHEENKGQISAWHTGYEASSGDYIQLHDDDDWMDSTKIEKQVASLERTSNAGVAFCSLYNVTKGSVEPVAPEYGRDADMLKLSLTNSGYPCQTTSMLIESRFLNNIFPLKLYPAGTDMPLQIELAEQTKFKFIDEFLMYHGYSVGSQGYSVETGRSHLQMIEDYHDLYNRYDQKVRKTVIASRYQMMAQASLENNMWSSDTIRYLLLSNYYHPGIDSSKVQMLLGSLLGQPGITLGLWFKRAIQS